MVLLLVRMFQGLSGSCQMCGLSQGFVVDSWYWGCWSPEGFLIEYVETGCS